MRSVMTAVTVWLWTLIIVFLSSIQQTYGRKLVLGVDGGTESIRACYFDATTGEVVGEACAVPYETFHPQPQWAEQRPDDWYNCLGRAVRGATSSIDHHDNNDSSSNDNVDNHDICCICVDTTCCSVVALDDQYQPLRNCLLWMDARSAPQTKKILDLCRGDPALDVNCGGEGPLSAEWMTPKALWIRENEPEKWDKSTTICEYQDFINYKLTGNMIASSCNAASRWHWDGNKCIDPPTKDDPFPGRPMSLYMKLGIPDLAYKLPKACVSMGDTVGQLTEDAAKHLGLRPGIPVAQGGPDAFVGMIGLGCIRPGQLALITGSSHLHCIVTDHATTAPGTWGAYKGAPLKGINFAEGGQSSTGSILRWARKLLGAEDIPYSILDEEAAQIPPGPDGLVGLETFQGARTPTTDPLARGALVGLTLSHTRGHIWRSLMESVCFGTRACLDGLAKAGHQTDDIIMAGGVTRSDVWLQMHADVTGKDVVVCEFPDAPLLGCAVLASVNAGVYESVDDAVEQMVRQARRIKPRKEVAKSYDELYRKTYCGLPTSTRDICHEISKLRGGSTSTIEEEDDKQEMKSVPTISPSLLACDWADMRTEIKRCLNAGTTRLHVGESAVFIFQREALQSDDEGLRILQDVVDTGMKCGISINPLTSLESIYPLLETGLISVVDILSVEAGFGGQSFQSHTIQKLERLFEYRERLKQSHDSTFDVMVDGGINKETAAKVGHTKPDILVSGSFLFNHEKSLQEGIKELELPYK